MDLETAIKRVKKCLALSRSANEHEAATALRQAQILMERFNLSAEGVLALDAGEARVKSKYKSRPPKWNWLLADAVASLFECQILFGSGSASGSCWIFVGQGGNPQVASYAYEVLLRQLIRAKQDFLDKLPKELGISVRRKLGSGFAEGWVCRVRVVIAQFAGSPKPPTAAVAAYIKQRGKPKEKKIGAFKNGDSLTDFARSAGLHEGAKAQIHRGVGADENQVLLSQ